MNRLGREICERITRVVKPAKFKKHGSNWYATLRDCIAVINLQKSQWSNRYYINIGVSPSDLIGRKTALEEDFDIRIRASQLTGCESLDDALNFADEVESLDAAASATLGECLRQQVMPFLMSLSTIEAIKEFLRSPLASRIAVRIRLREYFERQETGAK